MCFSLIGGFFSLKKYFIINNIFVTMEKTIVTFAMKKNTWKLQLHILYEILILLRQI